MTALVAWILSGFVGWLPWSVRLAVLVAVGVFLLANQAGLIKARPPQNCRQVPQTVYLRSPVNANLRFGFAMGTGVRTMVTALAPYLLLSLLVLFPPTAFPTVLAVGGVFGFTRGFVPMLWSASSRSPTSTRGQWDTLFVRSRVLIGWIALMICCAGASVILLTS